MSHHPDGIAIFDSSAFTFQQTNMSEEHKFRLNWCNSAFETLFKLKGTSLQERFDCKSFAEFDGEG